MLREWIPGVAGVGVGIEIFQGNGEEDWIEVGKGL